MPMTDIVERLRAYWPDGPGHQIAWEAAAEIERLRAALRLAEEKLEARGHRYTTLTGLEPKP